MEFIERFKNKSLKVGIIGLGYVGLPLGLEFAIKGFDVIGFDVDEKKIPLLMKGESYIKHIPEEKIKKALISVNCQKLTQLLYVFPRL